MWKPAVMRLGTVAALALGVTLLAAPAQATSIPASVPCAADALTGACPQPHGQTQTRDALAHVFIQKRHRGYTFDWTTYSWVLGPWSKWHTVTTL